MGKFFRGGSSLLIPAIAEVGWLRSLLWRWESDSRGDISMAERMNCGVPA
ncbi:MAG: hypothetical protein HQL70_04755 [Magnetococcales bacterium]|nr:hypothetical protein [Magnetococcales bacterium]